jgi:hypothetical protein
MRVEPITAHQLARLLLAGPDLPVVSYEGYDGGYAYIDPPSEVESCEVYTSIADPLEVPAGPSRVHVIVL